MRTDVEPNLPLNVVIEQNIKFVILSSRSSQADAQTMLATQELRGMLDQEAER
jgi:hypothetical protein